MILAIIEESTTGELSKEPCVSHHITQSIQTGQNIFKYISYTVIQLAKFNTPQEKIKTEREKWLWFMTQAPTVTNDNYHKFIGNDAILQNAYKMLLTTSYTPKELYKMGKADKEFEEHVAKIQEEHENGKAEGLKEGERNAKIETAINALKLGLSVDVVAKISGLKEDEALNLKK